MAKKQGGTGISAQAVEAIVAPPAAEMGLELVEVSLQKESRGKCLCIYVDKEGGLTLDDCEHYHKRIQPLLETVDYDFLEVSSPGIDRPIKTLRDFEKNRGARVEVRLFAPTEGSKTHTGMLLAMDEQNVTIEMEDQTQKTFSRKAVALMKPIIEIDLDGDVDL